MTWCPLLCYPLSPSPLNIERFFKLGAKFCQKKISSQALNCFLLLVHIAKQISNKPMTVSGELKKVKVSWARCALFMSTCECSVFMPIKKSPFGVRCAFGNEYPRLICHELIQFLKVASFQFKDDCTPVGSPCAALQRHTLSDWNRKRERCWHFR